MSQKVTPTQKALNVWALILIVWAFYRAKLQLPPWFDEFVAKPLVFVVPIYYYVVKVEGKDFFKSINLRFTHIFHDFGAGILVGIPILVTAVYAHYVRYHTLFPTSESLREGNLGFLFLMALATGFSEEMLSRGFVLKRLYHESKNIYASSFLASVLFFLLHIPILFSTPNVGGNTLLILMASTISLSLVNSFVFLAEGSLIIPILIHAFYNMSIYIFL